MVSKLSIINPNIEFEFFILYRVGVSLFILEKIKINMICAHAQCKQINQRYYRIEHAGHKSKSDWPVRPYSTSGTLFLLFVKGAVSDFVKSLSLIYLLAKWLVLQFS